MQNVHNLLARFIKQINASVQELSEQRLLLFLIELGDLLYKSYYF